MKVKSSTVMIIVMVALLVSLLFFIRRAVLYKEISVDSISTLTEGESCLQCHQNTKGFSNYHNPEEIGCTSCHLGNGISLIKDEAHRNMVLVPGNLSDAKETCGKCHASELQKIENSLMTTNSGIIAVHKFVFGESDSLNHHYHIKNLQHSAADKHLRDLCANCHLGAEKSRIWRDHSIESWRGL